MIQSRMTTVSVSWAVSDSKQAQRLRTYLLSSVAGTCLLFPAVAQELPTGASVTHGSVAITQAQPGAMTIDQGSDKAIVNWNSFSIGSGGHVNIRQPNSDSSMLNRVTGSTTSAIHGRMTANGQVHLVNPNGIFIGPTGTVNSGGFVASTLAISNEDFLSGRLRYRGNGNSATVENAGRVSIGRGGYAALLGGRVKNSGIVTVPMGKIAFGSGERAVLDFGGNQFLQVALPTGGEDDDEALIENSGTASAQGGLIEMRAATAREAVRQAVNLTGAAEARSVSTRNGKIILGGGAGGIVNVTGRVTTRATQPAVLTESKRPPPLPEIKISGQQVNLAGAEIDASATAGGLVRIGGDFGGAGDMLRADTVTVDAETTIRADALGTGDGGRVAIWSDLRTDYKAYGSVRGGPEGGDGGFFEVSSRETLQYSGLTDRRAPHGAAGMLLLDPRNIVSNPGAGAENEVEIEDDLELGDVTLDTSDAAGQGQSEAGNITINGDLDWTSGFTLFLNADNDIDINGEINAPSGSLDMIALGNISLNADVNLPGGTLGLNAVSSVFLNDFSIVTNRIELNADSFTGFGSVATQETSVSLNLFELFVGEGGGLGSWMQVNEDLGTFNAADFRLGNGTTFLRARRGDGSFDNPYVIADVFGLQGIASDSLLDQSFAFDFEETEVLNAETGEVQFTFRTGFDIDASGTAGWNGGAGFQPIGTQDAPFEGELDSFSGELVDLTVDRPNAEIAGLFGEIGEAGFVDIHMTDPQVIGDTYVGAVAGINRGLVYGYVGGSDPDRRVEGAVAGGLAGYNAPTGDLEGWNDAFVVARAQQSAPFVVGGSVAGINDGLLRAGLPFATVEGFGDNLRFEDNESGRAPYVGGDLESGMLALGGIAGVNHGTIEESTVDAQVIANPSSDASVTYAGGVVGLNCTQDGDVSLVGMISETESFSTVTLNLEPLGEGGGGVIRAGGVAGQNTAVIQDNAVFSEIVDNASDDFNEKSFGGIAGFSSGEIHTSFFAGSLPDDDETRSVEALIGETDPDAPVSTTDLFWDTTVTGLSGPSAFGLGLATEVFQDTETFVGLAEATWDFFNTWAPSDTGFYPELYVHNDVIYAIPDDTTGVYGDLDGLELSGNLFGSTSEVESNNEIFTVTGFPDLDANPDIGYEIDTVDQFTPSGSEASIRVVGAPTATLRVDPAPAITVTGPDLQKTYGDVVDLSENGISGVTVQGLRGDDELLGVTLESTGEPATATAGNHVIETSEAVISGFNGEFGPNYSGLFLEDGTLVVTPLSVEIHLDDQNKTYGETFAFNGTEFSQESLLFSDVITSIDLQSPGADSGANVGEYLVSGSDPSGNGLENYIITIVDGTMRVSQKDLTVVALDQTKTYGETLFFENSAPSDDFAVDGLVNGDTVTSVMINSDGAPTAAQVGGGDLSDGSYIIEAGDAEGSGLENYLISFLNGALTVTPKDLTITAVNQLKALGDNLVFDTTSPSDDFTIDGLIEGDVVDMVALSSAGAEASATREDGDIAVGEYTITVDDVSVSSGLNTNYDIVFLDGVLSIEEDNVPPPPNVTLVGLPNPSDSIGNGETDGFEPAAGTFGPGQAVDTLAVVQETSESLDLAVAACGQSSGDVTRYLACLSDALDSFSGELDAIALDLPPGLENVGAIIQTARQRIDGAATRAATRLALATSETERQEIRREAFNEAQDALTTASAEIRKAITLVRVDDPELANLQRATITTVAAAVDTTGLQLSRVVDL